MEEFPRKNDLVIATVKRIEEHGVIVTLDEYNGMEAYIPRSHAASGRIKDLRSIIKEGMKVVGRVLRSDRRKGQVDLSLRYVSDEEAERKMEEWKNRNRAISLLKLALGSSEAAYDAFRKLSSYYKDPLDALEDCLDSGPQPLIKAGIDEKSAEKIAEVVRSQIRPPIYVRKSVMRIVSYRPDGVDVIKSILSNINANVYTIGAPRYVIEVSSENPRLVKRTSEKIVEKIMEEIKGKGEAELIEVIEQRKRVE